jgi:hypothetical protein
VLTGGKALYSSTNPMPANSSPPLRRFLGLAGEPRFLGLAGEPRDPPLNIAPLLDFGTRAARFRETGNPGRLDRPMHLGAGACIPLMRSKWQRITTKAFYNFRL